jgi:glutaminyl-peptide cyclotransferase
MLVLLGLMLALSACGDDPPIAADTSTTVTTEAAPSSPPNAPDDTSPWPADFGTTPQQWTIRVLDRLPHDPTAFTQGLEMTDRGLLEGTGRRRESSLRLLDPDTGTVTERLELDPALFGEGLTVSGGEIIQLTWEAGRALRYDATSLEPTGEFTYDGEGWGICATDTELWMSNGTPQLTRRDPDTFAPLATVTVRRDGTPVDDLNELECIGDQVVANIWKSNEIVVIEPGSGAVVASIDASALVAEVAPDDEQAVLNGIADVGDGTLLLAGKLWPTLFVVEVIELADG